MTSVVESYSPSTITAGGTSTLTITLTNGSPTATNVSFTDTYAAGLTNAAAAAASQCSGTVSGAAGAGSLSLSGGQVTGSCTITVTVTACTAGSYTNPSFTTSYKAGSSNLTIGSTSATLTVTTAPVSAASSTVSASPASVPADGTSTSTITVTLKDGCGNPVSGKAVTLSAGSGSSTISPASATTNASGVATFTVKDGTPESVTYTARDTTDGVTVTQTASVTFTRLAAPTVTKSFSPTTIAANGTSTLTVTITNPNSGAITGLAFTDNYPANLKNAATPNLTNGCGGSASAAANGTSLSLSSGSLPGNGNCTITVSATSAVAGTYANGTGAVTSTNANSGAAASATLTVTRISAANSTISASPTSVPADNSTTSTITVTLKDGANNPVSGITVTLAAGSGSSTISPASATTNASGIATFTVKDGTAETVSYTATDTTDSPNITIGSTSVTFTGAPAATKSFSPTSVPSGNPSTLTITLSNPNAFAINGVAFTDSYPANLVNASTPNLSNSCGGTATGAGGGTSVSLSGASLAAGGSCTVQITVNSSVAGIYGNPSAAMSITSSSVQSGTLAAGAATLTVGPSQTNSAVVASPTSVPADNSTTSTITVTLKDDAGFPVSGKAVSLAAGSGSSTITVVGTGITNASGQAQFTVKDAVAESVTYAATDITDGIALANKPTVVFTAPVASFDVVESGAAKQTPLYTKVAGTTYSLDILALDAGGNLSTGYAGTVTLTLVDASTGGGVCASMTALAGLGSATFSAGTGRKSFNFSYADAVRNARIRVNDAVNGVTSCSFDSFTVRPATLVFTVQHANRTTAGTASTLNTIDFSPGEVHNAGRPFTIAVSAYNSVGALTPGYNGSTTPSASLAACGAAACPATVGTLALGTWSASGGTLTTNTATYDDVGAFNLQFQDASFAAASGDSSDGVSSYIVSSAASGVGRFVPDRFLLSATSLTPRTDIAGCSASAFTYMSEGFDVNFTLTAVDASGATTQRYTGALARLALNSPASYNFAAIDAAGPTVLGGRIDTGLVGSISTLWGAGVAANVAAPIAIQRAATPDGPFASAKVGFAPVDLDGVALDPTAINLDANNDSVNESALLATTAVRFGRLRMQNALGPESAVLPVPVRVEYWNGSAFVTNAQDSCTTLAQSDITLGSYAQNLAACETHVNQATVGFSAGVGTLTLSAAGGGNNGSVLLTPNLGAAPSGNYCPASPGAQSPATAAGKAYLQGAWSGGAWNQDPSARATFGLYGSQPNNFIYFRENY